MRKIFYLIALTIIVSVSGCTSTDKKPKYVFLFIGDGMGVNQVYSTELFLAAQLENENIKSLSFSNFPVQSYMTTYSANSWVTCSSASGTALASGFKTNNGVLGKDTSLTINYETIAEKAKVMGYKVGILSSVAIDHATPASFYANQDSRSMYYEISMELPKSNFDYFGGGGFHYPTGRDSSKTNAYDNALDLGYTIADSKQEFDQLKNGDTKVFAMNPALYPYGEFYWAIDKVKKNISLADFTRKGIEVIDNPKGFFMMVEGGKIDWAGHANDGATLIHETLAFDAAVQEAVKFYKNHPDETLIIVTADHETGGLILGNGSHKVSIDKLANQKISLQEFTRKMAELKQTNPEVSFESILEIVKADFGLGVVEYNLTLSEKDLAYLKKGYDYTFRQSHKTDADADYLSEKEPEGFPERVVILLNKKAGLSWASYSHSGTPVPLSAIGAGQEKFKSSIDNTDVPKIISELMGL